jgi:hypothetical protein
MRYFLFFSMLLAAFLLPDRAAKAQTLTTITDPATGIQLGLPPELLESRSSAKWGTNWHYAGNTLNIDTLNFGNRSLADLNGTLRSIRGRRITNASMTHSHLMLEGRDGDGTQFHIMIERQGVLTRGLSIVYSSPSYEPLVRSIAASLVAFPEFRAPQPSPPIAAPSPPPDGASERVGELARELERVKEQLRQQELERERQQTIEAIRKQERERLEQEYALREKERLAALSVERERAAREAKALADERLADEQRRAQKLGASADDAEALCGHREDVQASAAGCK